MPTNEILDSVRVGPIATNCMLLMNAESKELLIIDPGDEADKIEDKIKSMGGRPIVILLTHGHSDHIMAVEELKRDFPDIRIYAPEADREMLVNPSENSGFEFRPFHVVPDVLLKGGEDLSMGGFSIRVLATPGHTAGSLCYYLPEKKILFAGDTLFCGSYGRTDFATGSEEDMEKSLKMLRDTIPDDVSVYPGHMRFTTMAAEKKNNPGLR